jgi:hypothetical protein
LIDGKRVTAENAIRLGGMGEAYHVLEVRPGETRVASLSAV